MKISPDTRPIGWARPSHKTGVNRVLERGTNQAEEHIRQLKQTEGEESRIIRNDKGTAHFINYLSNPLYHLGKLGLYN
jgi:hypothetical protein